jgi:hypothetical protein
MASKGTALLLPLLCIFTLRFHISAPELQSNTAMSFSEQGGPGLHYSCAVAQGRQWTGVYLARIRWHVPGLTTIGHGQLVLSAFLHILSPPTLIPSFLPLLVLLSQSLIIALKESLFCLITLDGGSRCRYGRFNLCNVPISPEDWSPSLLIQMQLRRHSTLLALCAFGLRPVIIGSWHRTPLVPATDEGSTKLQQLTVR